MPTLTLTPRKLTLEAIEDLEHRGLIARLRPPVEAMRAPEGQFKAKAIYKTDPMYGGHMLFFVSLNLQKGVLNYHPANEEVFLLNRGELTKPLIWVFALCKRDEIEAKVAAGTLSSTDFAAYEVPFNDPELSCFTIFADTPHYEITPPGSGQNPFFWVGESADLPRIDIDLKEYIIEVV